jgi:hypothetical protein
MSKVKIISYQSYQGIINDNTVPLVGNETLYPEEFVEPFIKTFTSFDALTMKNYYFNITNLTHINIYLQPKYTYNNYLEEIMGCKCIIVSNEIFSQYFEKHDLENLCEFHMIYNIPYIDILSLKKIEGDFPQDCTIDVLLTDYLESCTIINYLQEFTLSFKSNEYPFKNYIKFCVTNITYKTLSVKNIDNRLEEINTTILLNKNLHKFEYDIGLNECFNKVINFYWHDSLCEPDKAKIVGLVANNEVKIDFIEEAIEIPIQPEPRVLQKARGVPPIKIDKPIFVEKGLVLSENVKTLTKEEIRAQRINNLSKHNT